MNRPEIPKGWRRLAIGEPIPNDAMWLSENITGDWEPIDFKIVRHIDRYRDSHRIMITRQPTHWVTACGVVDIGTDR